MLPIPAEELSGTAKRFSFTSLAHLAAKWNHLASQKCG
jgi:hypothetical protein